MRALIVGAGNIGLGFLGHLLWKSGLYSITFIEAQPERVLALTRDREYVVRTVSLSGPKEEIVRPVQAIVASDRDAVLKAVVDADLILTAVGKPNLIRIAPLIREGLVARLRQRPHSEAHVIVIACENVYDNTRYLEGLVTGELPEEDRDSIRDFISFPSCMVDRIVPASSAGVSQGALTVTVEDYFQFVVDGTALKAEFPAIPGIEVSTHLPAKLEQKLFTLNMLHGIVGYWGALAGHEFVHEAVGDKRVALLAGGALKEVARVLCDRHPYIAPDVQERYGEVIMTRFRNPHLQDPISRVASQPIRKLGGDERLVKPARLAVESGDLPAHLAVGIAAAFRYSNKRDIEAAELVGKVAEEGIDAAITSITGLDATHRLAQLVRSDYLLSSLR